MHLRLDQPRTAAREATEAHAVQRDTGHRLGQARALRVLGDAVCRTTGPAAARRHWQVALALYADMGMPEAADVRALLLTPET